MPQKQSISSISIQHNHHYPTPPHQSIQSTTMAPLIKKYKAAAVNAEPGWLDLELSVEKTIHWINEAGKNGCKLIAFPELWIPG
jgi:hypothetical protein